MNKWQKIVGVIAFGAIGICELLVCANTYLDLKYIIEPYRYDFNYENDSILHRLPPFRQRQMNRARDMK